MPSPDDLSAKVQAALQKKTPVMLSSLAAEFCVEEKAIALALPADMAKTIPGDSFEKVWEALAAWEKATFIIQHGGHVFEIKTRIAAGKTGRGYYNILGKEALGGHIRADDIADICFLSLPFMGLESHSVQFFDAGGHVVFSIYAGRGEDRRILPEVKEKFLALKASF